MNNRQRFFTYIKETGINPLNHLTFWHGQFDLLEKGIIDARLHDSALVAHSRLEVEITGVFCEEINGN